MNILLVTATEAEVAPVVTKLRRQPVLGPRLTSYQHRNHDIDVLTTGVGMVATAVWCARALASRPYDLAINAGLCGTFDRAIPLSTVVHVTTDLMPELGAEDGEAFLSLRDLKLLGENELPFAAGALVNATPPDNAALRGLPSVVGATVNTVHGRDESIARLLHRCAPQVESMEGAAFMYACLVQGLPFAQIRAVSNIVERRNRQAWKIPEAIAALGASVMEIIATL